MLGGEIKWTTEAVIGIEAINSLKKYNFTKGFLEPMVYLKKEDIQHRILEKLWLKKRR